MAGKTRRKTAALAPNDIEKEIESHPPLRREEAKQAYIGKRVDWLAIFRNGKKESSGLVWLTFETEQHIFPMVHGSVSLAAYPWLASLKADTIVRVRGRIRRIEAISIELEILELSVPKLEKV